MDQRGGGTLSLTPAFTLAEVLITLGIIGVVAAMTMPSLIAKHQKQVTATRLKKAYSTLSQAMKRSEVDNSEYINWEQSNVLGAEAYFEKYFKPYFNNPNICLTSVQCGYNVPQPFKYLNGEKQGTSMNVTGTGDSRIIFYLSDGTLYTIFTTGDDELTVNNAIFIDINGGKGPNIVGKDVFSFRRTEKGIVPFGYGLSSAAINSDCSLNGTGNYCAAKIMQDGWQITSDYPW